MIDPIQIFFETVEKILEPVRRTSNSSSRMNLRRWHAQRKHPDILQRELCQPKDFQTPATSPSVLERRRSDINPEHDQPDATLVW